MEGSLTQVWAPRRKKQLMNALLCLPQACLHPVLQVRGWKRPEETPIGFSRGGQGLARPRGEGLWHLILPIPWQKCIHIQPHTQMCAAFTHI